MVSGHTLKSSTLGELGMTRSIHKTFQVRNFNKQELSLDSLDLDSFKTDLNTQIKTGTLIDQPQERYILDFTNQSTI